MSDLFHKDVPDLFVRQCFEVMLDTNRHTYQILTKRPTRARRFVIKHADLFGGGRLPPHIWIGTSVEDQAVEHRIRHLLDVPAAVRFLSCEPLLGPIGLASAINSTSDDPGLHWVIVGGESGPMARPLDPRWVRSLRDEAASLGIPFFFKQWGGLTPKAGGRRLDGETWDEYPSLAVGQ